MNIPIIRLIFKDTYSLYKRNKEFPLFQVISVLLPFVEESAATSIMTDTYNLFTKYKDVRKDEDWCELCKEAKELNKKYEDSDLASQILVEILNILEERYTNKNNSRKG